MDVVLRDMHRRHLADDELGHLQVETGLEQRILGGIERADLAVQLDVDQLALAKLLGGGRGGGVDIAVRDEIGGVLEDRLQRHVPLVARRRHDDRALRGGIQHIDVLGDRLDIARLGLRVANFQIGMKSNRHGGSLGFG